MATFCVSVLYPSGPDIDMTYYVESHLPLVDRLLTPLGMTGMAYWRPVEDNPDAAYQLIADLRFSSREAGLAALQAHGPETQADIANFTAATPVIMTGDLNTI